MSTFTFVVNPISGGIAKKGVVQLIGEYIKNAHSYEIEYTKYPGHATEIARKSLARSIVAVGGDGTVCEVAKGILGTGKSMGIIPCGHGDAMALHIGISRDPIKAVRQLNSLHMVDIDYATVNGEPFFASMGFGLSAMAAKNVNRQKKHGFMAYLSKAWQAFDGTVPEDYIISVDGEEMEVTAPLLTVCNANQWGDHAMIAPGASIRDGKLDLVAIRPFGKLSVPGILMRLRTGRIASYRKTLTLSGEHIQIHRGKDGTVQVDGDHIEMGKDLDIRCVKGGLKMIVPRKGREDF